MAPGYTEYIKLKESEKTAEARRSLWPFLPFSLETGHKTLVWQMPSQCPEERSSLSLRTKVENKVKTLALGLPQLTTLTVLSIQYHIPPWMSTLYENQYKHTQVCVCTSPFPYEAPVSHKTYRKYIYMLFSHLSVFLSFRSCQRP